MDTGTKDKASESRKEGLGVQSKQRWGRHWAKVKMAGKWQRSKQASGQYCRDPTV